MHHLYSVGTKQINNNNSKNKTACPYCAKLFKPKGLGSHMRACGEGEKAREEEKGGVNEEEVRLLQCASCGKKFTRVDTLKRHKKLFCHFDSAAAGNRTKARRRIGGSWAKFRDWKVISGVERCSTLVRRYVSRSGM